MVHPFCQSIDKARDFEDAEPSLRIAALLHYMRLLRPGFSALGRNNLVVTHITLMMMPSTNSSLTAATTREIELFVGEFLATSDPESYLRDRRASGALLKVLPEAADLWGPRGAQDPRWHPEGDVWEHTMWVVRNGADSSDKRVRLSTLFHDWGKPHTFFRHPGDGRISNPGHEHVSANLLESVVGPRLGLDRSIIEDTGWLCRFHMVPQQLKTPSTIAPHILKEITSHRLSPLLVELHRADANGTSVSPDLRRDFSGVLQLMIDDSESV